jgi:4-nitrophenyl phosphatase
LTAVSALVLDVDGTLMRGDAPIPGAVEAVANLRRNGYRVVYCSQESAITDALMAVRLARAGFSARVGEVVTAGEVALDRISRRHPGAPVYLSGTAALRRAAAARGLRLLADFEARQAEVLLVARDPAFGHGQLEAACRALWSGACFYAVALDRVIPVEGGFIPGTGPLVKAIQHATARRPTVLGKPSPWPLRTALSRIGVRPSSVAYVGDSPSSDVTMGNRVGCHTVLVRSGGALPPADAIPSRARPDIVLPDITHLGRWLASRASLERNQEIRGAQPAGSRHRSR